MPLDTHLQQQCCPVARIRKSVIFWPAAKQLPIENALELQCGVCPPQFVRLSTITGLNYWTDQFYHKIHTWFENPCILIFVLELSLNRVLEMPPASDTGCMMII